MRTTDTWMLQAISNLHAGKGDADFGIIDKHVQRDPVTELPTIFASSIKGALRELFETNPTLKKDVKDIFGSDAKGNDHTQGGYRFYDARLLAIPVRSSHQFYFLATCPEIIEDFLTDLDRQGFKQLAEIKKGLLPLVNLEVEEGKPQYAASKDFGKILLEELYATKTALDKASISTFQSILLADRFAIFNGNDFNQICQELPTVARNHLDNGISQNLWYEEIVPRESRFYFFTSRSDVKEALADGLKSDAISNLVQIGGNATVGFGLCEIKKLSV